jgi:hypothetical protein
MSSKFVKVDRSTTETRRMDKGPNVGHEVHQHHSTNGKFSQSKHNSKGSSSKSEDLEMSPWLVNTTDSGRDGLSGHFEPVSDAQTTISNNYTEQGTEEQTNPSRI